MDVDAWVWMSVTCRRCGLTVASQALRENVRGMRLSPGHLPSGQHIPKLVPTRRNQSGEAIDARQ